MSLWDLLAQGGKNLIQRGIEHLKFKLPTEPVPDEWHSLLSRNVPLANELSHPERDRLLRVARLLLEEVPFEGCNGLEVDDEMRVTIAATAALLVFRLPLPKFTRLVRVLVYPDTFIPVNAESPRDSMIIESDPSLGQAWMNGVVILAWSAIREEMRETTGDRSVILHEMAHILDAEDGRFDGTPLLDDRAQGAAWAEILEREFERQQTAVDSEAEPPLDSYAARNHAEFFAVATEAFFCQPNRLRERLPALYDHMHRFYRPDMARL
jgi:MtfA peptidase